MAILKIARMGHPILRRVAQEIEDPGSDEVARLIEDMIETLKDVDGAGLAAPQVHVPKRLILFTVPDSRTSPAEDDQAVDLQVLINPVVEPITEEKTLGWEACLSIPGMMGAVPRFRQIHYSGVTPDGRAIDRTVSGFHARVVQHEYDHLDGILYPMRITDMSLFGFADEINRAIVGNEKMDAAAE